MILNCRYHVYHIIVSYITLKLDALGYISVAAYLHIFNQFYIMHPGKIIQNKGHCTIQGHSTSPSLILNYLLSCTVSDTTNGQGSKWHKNIAENFNRLSRVHKRYRQTTDGRATAYSYVR